jgi:DNA-binding response OmpR family regulator
MIAKGLREHGHAVDVVMDGGSAIQHASTVSYDVVVLDLSLPVKDGLDVVVNSEPATTAPRY